MAAKRHKKHKKGTGMSEGDVFETCDAIRRTALSLHGYLRNGHLEKVYENGLASRLRKLGMAVQQQVPLAVYDEDGTLLGEYFADLVVNGWLIIELKAVAAFADEHIAQVLGYLRACRVEHALLINFGAPKLGIRKLILSDRF